ncbi:cytochrome C oxidase subunit IV family protein [Williamsia sp.]|uniref:cytochrome C oxidase subunit IV family protein n=1 Tax=Williamsia sp. TaxID=1872085 RepID=UPI002F92168B
MTAEPMTTGSHPAERGERTARAVNCAWIVLCAITIGSWWLAPGHSGSSNEANVAITVTVILLGFIKGRLIIRYFMEVRSAPQWLKIATDAWLLVLWTAILVIYLV